MEYYVIYDLKDNIIAYIENLEELATFTNVKKKYLKFRFKTKDIIYYQYNSLFHLTYRKIYKFSDFPYLIQKEKETQNYEIQ